jgi:hypothetical protein
VKLPLGDMSFCITSQADQGDAAYEGETLVLKTAKLCSICHQVEVTQRHDVLKRYICAACEARKPHATFNLVSKGKACKLPAFSLEFEIAAEHARCRRALILLQYQFQRTYDSTVSDEYQSPIYQNMRAFHKPLMVLHELRDLVDERCGTHLHVAFNQKKELYFAREAVFGPLIAHLSAHEEQTIAFWGRTFCEQASAMLIDGERHVCFNTRSRHPTIEYRLPRFRSGEQYLAVVQFCRSTTAFLERSFTPSLQLSSNPLTPERIGEQVLARYKKVCKAFNTASQNAPLVQ